MALGLGAALATGPTLPPDVGDESFEADEKGLLNGLSARRVESEEQPASQTPTNPVTAMRAATRAIANAPLSLIGPTHPYALKMVDLSLFQLREGLR